MKASPSGSLFLFSCANENVYDCKIISHDNDLFKACGPKLTSTCTTNSGQDGSFYYLYKWPYEESWYDNPSKLSFESIWLSNKDFIQKGAQAKIDPWIYNNTTPKCLGLEIDIEIKWLKLDLVI